LFCCEKPFCEKVTIWSSLEKFFAGENATKILIHADGIWSAEYIDYEIQ